MVIHDSSYKPSSDFLVYQAQTWCIYIPSGKLSVHIKVIKNKIFNIVNT